MAVKSRDFHSVLQQYYTQREKCGIFLQKFREIKVAILRIRCALFSRDIFQAEVHMYIVISSNQFTSNQITIISYSKLISQNILQVASLKELLLGV